MRRIGILMLVVALLVLRTPATINARVPEEMSSSLPEVFIDGRRLPLIPPPIIQNDREKVIMAAVSAYESEMKSCANVLCVNPGDIVFTEPPGVIRTLLYHLEIANEVADRVPLEAGKQYTHYEAFAALAALPAEAYEAASQSSRVVSSPSPSLVAILLTVLTMKVDSNPDIAIIQEAQDAQRKSGYRPDQFETCTLKANSVLFLGFPSGDSPWYTNLETVKASQFDARVLFQSLQVFPSMRHGGYRYEVREVEVTREIRVACGSARANRVVRAEDGQWIYAGEGGGWQYYVPAASRDALRPLLRRITLDNWRVPDWGSLFRGG